MWEQVNFGVPMERVQKFVSRPKGPGKVCAPRKPSKIKASLILTLVLAPAPEGNIKAKEKARPIVLPILSYF